MSSAEATLAHRLGHPERVTGLGEEVPDVLAALVGVEDHPVDLAAAHRSGHAQRCFGERRVVVLTEGEARQPPGPEVQHDRQVQLALAGGDLGQVTAPTLINGPGRVVPLHQVREEDGTWRRSLKSLDRVGVWLRPTLFAYQFLYELVPAGPSVGDGEPESTASRTADATRLPL